MNTLNELLDTLQENNIARVLRMNPLPHAKNSPAMVSLRSAMTNRGLGSDDAPFFTFVNENEYPISQMEPNLRAALEQQIEAVLAPLAGSHFDLEGWEAQINKEEAEDEGEDFPLPSYVVTDLDVSTGIISDTYTSPHVAHQIHNGYSPINSDFLTTLKELGVAEFNAGYGGSGDSGEVMEISCTNDNGEAIPIDAATQEKIEGLVYHLLAAHEPGWEINEGSDGELTVNVETGAIKIEHNNNISETETNSYSQLLSELGDNYTADLKAAHDELVAIMPEGATLTLDYDWAGTDPDDVNNGITESWHNWTCFVQPENPSADNSRKLTEQETEIALRFARPLIIHLAEASYKDSTGTLIFNQDTGVVTIEDHIEHEGSEYREARDRLITATVYDPSDEVDVMKPAKPKM